MSDNITLLLVLVFYLAVIAYLGYRGYKNTVSHNDYLVAGRSVHPFVMAMSYGAAFISTSAIVGFGGMAGYFGMAMLFLPLLNIVVGVFIAFVFFGKATRRIGQNLNSCTFPEFMGMRFQSGKLQFVSALIITLFMPLYCAVVLIGGARFIGEITPLSYETALLAFALFVMCYVVIGGLKGVMYIDALMGSIMAVGMLFLVVMSYVEAGGFISAHAALTDMVDLVPENVAKIGHAGWTQMPTFNSPWWWTLVTSLMLGVGIGALAQPQLVVRFMTVKGTKQLNRAVLIGSIFIFITAGGAYLVGALSNVWFMKNGGKIAIDAAGGNPDRIIPIFIDKAMPKFFVYIFAVTLLSAAMSTLSALCHVMGSSIGHDIAGKFCSGNKSATRLTKAGIIWGVFCSIVVAFLLPDGIVARGTAIFFGICAAAFLPAYSAAIYWKRATLSGVWASMLTGTLSSAFCLVFMHRAESKALGICEKIFGRTELISLHPWPYVDSLVISLPLSLLALVVVSLLTRPPTPEHIEKCFAVKKNDD